MGGECVTVSAMPPVRKRPRDRKLQVERAAADAFSAAGFHAVSMGDIATKVGITAAALYRHANSKYDLFRAAVLALSSQLVACTDFVDGPDRVPDPGAALSRLVDALIDTSIANRSSGGLYRWEGRYLLEADQSVLREQLKLVNRRLQHPVMMLRPELSARERWTLSSAALSVIGSIADHRASLPVAQIRSVLKDLAIAVLSIELPAAPHTGEPVGPSAVPVGRYEAVLRESLKLFHIRGYPETSVEDIAAAVGMPTSGIYRYFTGKSDILAASFRRAADRISADVSNTVAVEPDPARALIRLAESYIVRSFEAPELAYLYYTERVHLPPSDERQLRNIQLDTVESWADLVCMVRPQFGLAEARFVVHAAFGLVVDLGRLMNYDNSALARARVLALMVVTLFGPGNTPDEIPEASGIAVNLVR